MKSFIQFLKTRILNESINAHSITISQFDKYIQNLIYELGPNYNIIMHYLIETEGLHQQGNNGIALLDHFRTHYSYLNKTRDTDFRDTIHSFLPTRQVPTEIIEELTQEQRAAIPQFVRSWINAILNHRTNEGLVKDAFSHLGFNNVTFVDSLEGIGEILANTRWYRVRNQVYNQVYNQVMYQVLDQVTDQVRNQVGNQVTDQVTLQANFAMFSYYENVLNIEITNPNYEHVKDILINTRFIFSTNNQNEIFVLRK